MVRQLESRILLSASPAAAVADGSTAEGSANDGLSVDATAESRQLSMLDCESAEDDSLSECEPATDGHVASRRELLFVDGGVADYEQLMNDVADSGPDREVLVARLDPDLDGIEQITAVLAGYDDLDAVHFLSHGTDGAVKLGNAWLTSDNLAGYAGSISHWADSLNTDADLLFYGCDLADGSDGEVLLESLHILTGADVAASVDDTGHASLGGDWDLEHSTSSIETAVIVSPQTQAGWQALLNTFTVTNTNNAGAGSLRQAINDANALSGTDEIHFNIGAPLIGGAHTISLTSALPVIAEAVIIDGTTDADYVSAPIIELNGTLAGPGVDGLVISGGGTTIRGLVINRFQGAGIYVHTAGGNTIEHNFIGTDVTGTIDRGNWQDGISIEDSDSNQIGGTTVATRNVISGNNENGIIVFGTSTNNDIQGNYIGIDVTGTVDLGNTRNGIRIDGADNNLIGGTAVGAGNVISGNNIDGVAMYDLGSTGNLVQGNYIGTNATGTSAIANSLSGVMLAGAPLNTIGGAAAGAGNVISGNLSAGVQLRDVGTWSNVVRGNLIGVDATGISPLGNVIGVEILASASNNLIGGSLPGEGNVLSANSYAGVAIHDSGTDSNRVLGNAIGPDAPGTGVLGNGTFGVAIWAQAAGNLIGGIATGEGNIVVARGTAYWSTTP